jgi:hypothetical protein
VPVILVSVGLNMTKFFETEYYTIYDEEEAEGEVSKFNNVTARNNAR